MLSIPVSVIAIKIQTTLSTGGKKEEIGLACKLYFFIIQSAFLLFLSISFSILGPFSMSISSEVLNII